ncbi:gTPase obg [Firmicutes bacterium CAG:460]|jgi:GTP-binding protein|nr:gTPase obg [Firmicutes bacterium CAG:460]
MFVDELTIKLLAGSGGDGCTSFRREKFVPMGGPDGGNGGKGASIIFEVDKNLKTLVDLSYRKIIKAPKGENGKGSNKYGKNAEDIIIAVPEGTTVINTETNEVMADLINDKERFVVAHGGRGGKGNKSFATHDVPAPKFSEKGEPGEEVIVKLELKVLADVGLIGMPSVGKSTLLSVISASKPKIAAYHFTTLNPNLGVVKLKNGDSFVMADLPGLIEGASNGVGLGIEFLKHAMRTRIIAHVVDMGSSEGRNPSEDYRVIREEIEKYSEILKNKKEVVIASKMDLADGSKNLEEFKKNYPNVEVIPISAFNMEGIDEMIERLMEILKETPKEELYPQESFKVYKYEDNVPYKIKKDGNIWVVSGKEIETLLLMTKFNEDEGVLRFARKFKGMGIEDELEKMGAKVGDEVQILDYMFTFKG